MTKIKHIKIFSSPLKYHPGHKSAKEQINSLATGLAPTHDKLNQFFTFKKIEKFFTFINLQISQVLRTSREKIRHPQKLWLKAHQMSTQPATQLAHSQRKLQKKKAKFEKFRKYLTQGVQKKLGVAFSRMSPVLIYY